MAYADSKTTLLLICGFSWPVNEVSKSAGSIFIIGYVVRYLVSIGWSNRSRYFNGFKPSFIIP